LNDPALPEGNVLDPDMTFVNASAHNYALAAGSPAINTAKDPGLWKTSPPCRNGSTFTRNASRREPPWRRWMPGLSSSD